MDSNYCGIELICAVITVKTTIELMSNYGKVLLTQSLTHTIHAAPGRPQNLELCAILLDNGNELNLKTTWQVSREDIIVIHVYYDISNHCFHTCL